MSAPSAPLTHPLRRNLSVACALALTALAPALVSAWLHPRAPAWTQPVEAGTLTWDQAHALPNALWIDARSDDDFARSHVPGALSLPPADWDAHILAVLEAWQPDQPVIVYCGGNDCHASHAVALRLRDELALPEIHVLAGGWPNPSAPAP